MSYGPRVYRERELDSGLMCTVPEFRERERELDSGLMCTVTEFRERELEHRRGKSMGSWRLPPVLSSVAAASTDKDRRSSRWAPGPGSRRETTPEAPLAPVTRAETTAWLQGGGREHTNDHRKTKKDDADGQNTSNLQQIGRETTWQTVSHGAAASGHYRPLYVCGALRGAGMMQAFNEINLHQRR